MEVINTQIRDRKMDNMDDSVKADLVSIILYPLKNNSRKIEINYCKKSTEPRFQDSFQYVTRPNEHGKSERVRIVNRVSLPDEVIVGKILGTLFMDLGPEHSSSTTEEINNYILDMMGCERV